MIMLMKMILFLLALVLLCISGAAQPFEDSSPSKLTYSHSGYWYPYTYDYRWYPHNWYQPVYYTQYWNYPGYYYYPGYQYAGWYHYYPRYYYRDWLYYW